MKTNVLLTIIKNGPFYNPYGFYPRPWGTTRFKTANKKGKVTPKQAYVTLRGLGG
jgi:hypothetical protein